MATQEWCRRVCIMALVGSLFVLTEVAGKPGPVGYGSYDNYNHGPSYNLIPEQPVVKKVVDFYAKPKYSFGYEVEDYYNQLSHGRWEIRDGDVTQGQYRVLLPDGRIQIVSYVADKAGYRPHIQYIGKGVHPPPPPTYANVKIPHQYVEPLVAAAPVLQGPPVLAAQVPVTIPHGPEYGHHYGGDYGYDTVLSPSRISKKRALLYDRTLFRRDIPKPPTPPRK